MAHLRDRYGSVVRYTGIGQADCVFVTDTAILRDILVVRPELFPKDTVQVCGWG